MSLGDLISIFWKTNTTFVNLPNDDGDNLQENNFLENNIQENNLRDQIAWQMWNDYQQQ